MTFIYFSLNAASSTYSTCSLSVWRVIVALITLSDTHTHTRASGRTPLDEWSAHRIDLYITHNPHKNQTSVLSSYLSQRNVRPVMFDTVYIALPILHTNMSISLRHNLLSFHTLNAWLCAGSRNWTLHFLQRRLQASQFTRVWKWSLAAGIV